MEIIDLIRTFLTPQAIAVQMTNRQPAPQRIRNLIYGEGLQHPFAAITLAELKRTLTNVPVVRRGSAAFAMNLGNGDLTTIDVQGFELSDFLTATEINNLKMVSSQAAQSFVEARINHMLDTIQRSTEALCAQGLTGKLVYPMKTDLAEDTYEVDFGDTQNFTPPLLWNGTGAKIVDVFETLSEMHGKLQATGNGANPVTLAGRKSFSQIINLADESKSNIVQVKIINNNEISVGGYTVQLENGVYRTTGNVMTRTVDENKVVMVDKDAGHSLRYLALDDLESGLLPMPFYPSQELKKNPSGMEIVGRSKPLPAPVVGAICWSTVMAAAKSAK
ncbi:Phage major capsid protein E [compost metagenome]